MSCNKFPNKCASGIGIMSKNQPKFDLMPSHGFWSGRLNVASVENRVSDTLVHSMGAPDVDLTYGLWMETPGIYGWGGNSLDLYDDATRFDTVKMTKWIQGLDEFIEKHKVTRLVVRLPNITGPSQWELANFSPPQWPNIDTAEDATKYWEVISRKPAPSDPHEDSDQYGAAGSTGSCIYSLDKSKSYTLASLVVKYDLEVLWLPEIGGNLRFSGPNPAGADINADGMYPPQAEPDNYYGYKNWTNPNTDREKQINADTKFMVKCCKAFQVACDVKKTGLVWEVEGVGIQWQYNRDATYPPEGQNITFNPIYAASLSASDALSLDTDWTWGLCYYIKAAKQDASFPTIASIWASSGVKYKLELFPEWYGWPEGGEKAGPDKPCLPELVDRYDKASTDPSQLSRTLTDHWASYDQATWKGELIGSPLLESDTPAIASLPNADKNIVAYWKSIWEGEGDDRPPGPTDWKKQIINFRDQLQPQAEGVLVLDPLRNLNYTALVSIESFYMGGPPSASNECGFPKQWTLDTSDGKSGQMNGWMQEIANLLNKQSLNTMYFSATYIFPGLNNQTTGPVGSTSVANFCGCDISLSSPS